MQLVANHKYRVCQKIIHVLCISQGSTQDSDKQICSLCQNEDNVSKIIMTSKQVINAPDKTGRWDATGADGDEHQKAGGKRLGPPDAKVAIEREQVNIGKR